MTAVRLSKPVVIGLPISKEMDEIDKQIDLNNRKDEIDKVIRHKKKKKKERNDERKRKRSLSWSTETTACCSVTKHKKKKRKHRRNQSPPSPRVNPIFLWVKQDNTKIVEVLCEDYDKRNRIKLTKTAGGWRAIPRTERLSRQSSDSLVNKQTSRDAKDYYDSDESLTICEHNNDEDDDEDRVMCQDNSKINSNNNNDDNNQETDIINNDIIESIANNKVTDNDNDDIIISNPDEFKSNNTESENSETKINNESIDSNQTPSVPEIDVYEFHDDNDDNDNDDEQQQEINEEISRITADLQQDDEIEFPEVINNQLNTEDILTNALVGCNSSDDNDNGEDDNKDKENESNVNDDLDKEPIQGKENLDNITFDTDENPIQRIIDDDNIVKSEPELKLIEEETEKCYENNTNNNDNEVGLDENHNNESVQHDDCLLEDDNFCREVDECVEKTLGDLIGELEERAMNRASRRLNSNNNNNNNNNNDDNNTKDEQMNDQEFLGTNCNDLMDELEEMCHGIMNERLKNFDSGSKNDLTDLYSYVPNSDVDEVTSNVNEIKPTLCDDTSNIEDIKAIDNKADSPMNLVVQDKVTNDILKLENDNTQLKNYELENLDILWKLPEGTTVHHSRGPSIDETRRPRLLHVPKNSNPLLNIPKLNPYKTYVPEQIEPLNLGKPKSKIEEEPLKLKNTSQSINKIEETTSITAQNNSKPVKTDKIDTSSKLLELLTSEEKSDPLDQLKEVLSDPNLSVPDPLLVPRERLSALIANPAKEIPRLLSQKQEIKYPKFDADLLVVSLTHLQMLLQNSVGKDEDLKLYQQHAQMLQSQLNTGKECPLDPATANMINQMFWLPYLEQLQMARSTNPQEFLAMLNNVVTYPPYAAAAAAQWSQHGYEYAQQQQQQMISLWQDMMQKPNLTVPPTLSKSYNDLYKSSNNQSNNLLNNYGQNRPNKINNNNHHHHQMISSGSTSSNSGTASRSTYSRSIDGSYTNNSNNNRRQSKSSRHNNNNNNHGINNNYMRQQSWPLSHCNIMPSANNHDNTNRLSASASSSSSLSSAPANNNPYLMHGVSSNPRLSHPMPTDNATSSSAAAAGYHQPPHHHSNNNNHHHHHHQHHHTTVNNHHSIHDSLQPNNSSSNTSSTTGANNLPKLKVRDFGIDPSRRPNNLLKFGDPHFVHPGSKFPDANHSNLWHPLFSSQEGKSYISPWQWTTPVTVSGD